jgi:translation initiation factor eIF-2B subunit delta
MTAMVALDVVARGWSMRWESLLDRLAGDRTSGAQELTRLASSTLSSYLASEQEGRGCAERLLWLTRRILDSQPAMAPIITLLNHLWLRLEQMGECDSLLAALAAELEQFGLEIELRLDRLAEACLDRLAEGNVVLVHSYSSTVLRALLAAHEAGKGIRVICSEGRPALEGVRLAEALAVASVPVELCVDAALPGRAAEADVVLVGADAVTETWAINKIGTYPLALAANATGRPFYLAASLDKLLPPLLAPLLRIPDRPPEEIWSGTLRMLHVHNRYFDVTPLALITGVMTEAGFWSRKKLLPALSKAAVSATMARLAEEVGGAEGAPPDEGPPTA